MQAEGKCGPCTEMVRLFGMEWSLFPGSHREISVLGKPGQAKWNQVGNRVMEERNYSCRVQPRLMADNDRNET